MASACRQFASRGSPSSIRSAIRSNAPKSPTSRFPLPTSSAPVRGFSVTRSTGVLGCVQSLLPLHSAVAAVRLTSALSTTSRSCRALSQGQVRDVLVTHAAAAAEQFEVMEVSVGGSVGVKAMAPNSNVSGTEALASSVFEKASTVQEETKTNSYKNIASKSNTAKPLGYLEGYVSKLKSKSSISVLVF